MDTRLRKRENVLDARYFANTALSNLRKVKDREARKMRASYTRLILNTDTRKAMPRKNYTYRRLYIIRSFFSLA